MTTEPDTETAETGASETTHQEDPKIQRQREQAWLERDDSWLDDARDDPQMTKREFMLAYVLGRCRGKTGDLGGWHVAKQAEAAWDAIVKATENG